LQPKVFGWTHFVFRHKTERLTTSAAHRRSYGFSVLRSPEAR
jgi:hypothetical protein